MIREILIVAAFICAFHDTRAEQICCSGLPCYQKSCNLPLPECPEKMGISMKVYTRQNPTIGQNITRSSIPSVFRGGVLSIYITHGWLQSEDFSWMHDIKNNLLAQGDYNVIIVGWIIGAASLSYPQSASNTRTVGAEIALVSNKTIADGGSSRGKQYCVGHSLGGHVCGHAGLQGQFGRITGLDPAGPLFETSDVSCRLSPSSADLVDVIHTNGLAGLGTLKRLGHVDFYPNGGSVQPGCLRQSFQGLLTSVTDLLTAKNTSLYHVFELVIGCNHERAISYFNESITTPCFLSRYKCSTQYFLPIPCSSTDKTRQSMGFNSTAFSEQGIFYLKTNSAAPFCKG